MAYQASILKTYRFDEDFERYQDIEFGLRVSLQYRLRFLSKAKLFHLRSPRERPDARRMLLEQSAMARLLLLRYGRATPWSLVAHRWSMVGVLILIALDLIAPNLDVTNDTFLNISDFSAVPNDCRDRKSV